MDLHHYYGGDLSASSSGDLLVASQADTGTQRIYRRLLTNPILDDASSNGLASADYIWQPAYGGGVPRKIGAPTDMAGTTAVIRGQMFLEAAVSRNPAPSIELTPTQNGISAYIQYTDAQTKTSQFLTFDADI
jgi:hypothetical protein